MKILIVALALLVSGCATNKEYAAYLAAVQSASVANGEVYKTRVIEMGKIAANAKDGSAQTAAVMAMTMIQMPATSFAPPPENEVASFIKAALPPLAMIGGMWIASDSAKFSAQMSRDVSMSTNSAFVGMGNNIQQAGVAGYPFIQAPGAITNTTTTNTNTLSGTGVMGSGTYNPVSNAWTNSYNTTRNCNAGSGGGTTTGAPGGSANC